MRTRNARLAAIRSLFKYAALRHPEHAATIQRVLAIPPKRFDQALITFLTEPELDALLAAPDQAAWIGRRDHAIMLLATQTGLRASELIGLACGDVQLGVGAHVSYLGKGRKQRITPLTKQTVAVMRAVRRMSSPLLCSTLAAVLALAAAGCGDDGGGSTELVCGDGTTAMLTAGGTVEVAAGDAAKDLAGASVHAQAETTVAQAKDVVLFAQHLADDVEVSLSVVGDGAEQEIAP